MPLMRAAILTDACHNDGDKVSGRRRAIGSRDHGRYASRAQARSAMSIADGHSRPDHWPWAAVYTIAIKCRPADNDTLVSGVGANQGIQIGVLGTVHPTTCRHMICVEVHLLNQASFVLLGFCKPKYLQG